MKRTRPNGKYSKSKTRPKSKDVDICVKED